MAEAVQLTLFSLEDSGGPPATISSDVPRNNGHHRFLAGLDEETLVVIACTKCGKRLNAVNQPCGCQGYGRGRKMTADEADDLSERSPY